MQIPVMRRGGGIIEANTNFRTVQDTTFSYTGDYVVIEDTATTWRIKFLTSGILTFYDNDIVIDIFGVGGGGAGAGYNSAASSPGGAGGSGYTSTVTNVSLAANEPYELIIGDGAPQSDKKVLGQDGKPTIFGDNILIANGGLGGSYSYARGGNGGSGGARSTVKSTTGGIDGGDGTSKDTDGDNEPEYAGKGQGTTTREFGEATGELYAYGGNSYYYKTHTYDGDPNTGNGGDGSSGSSGDGHGGAGGSGIIVIRKSASSTSSDSTTGFNFTVIGNTIQPENPVENTIWVNTDVEIGKWTVSISEPETPSVGDVWMQHCIEGFELDVIDENNLIVSITYVKQYSDSGWLVKEWEVYKNNTWIKYETDLCLYNLENGCLVEFGGMQDDASQVTVTNEQLRVYSYGYSNQNTDFLIYTVNPIDLTPYSTLELTINCDGTTQFKDYSYFGFVTSVNTGSYGQTYSASTKYSAVTSGDNTLTLDISNLSGNYYFATGGYGMTFTVKKICLGR